MPIAAINPYYGTFDLIGTGSSGGGGTVDAINVINIPAAVLAELGTVDNLAAVLIELTERSVVYQFTQTPASATWTIPHNLDTPYPTVYIRDAATECTVWGYDLVAIDNDNLQVQFDIPFEGSATLTR